MKKNLIFCYILVAAAAVNATDYDTDYCAMNCTVDGREIQHIACGNKGEFGRYCTAEAELIDMRGHWQNVVLDYANKLRNFTAGGKNATYDYQPACRMATIQWDDELAAHAALNAKQCLKEYDYCHTTERFRSSGQMAYRQLRTEGDKSINAFMRDTLKRSEEDIHKKGYDDLLADRNTHMGCGLVMDGYDYFGMKNSFKTYVLVCNFATKISDRDSMYEICESAAEKCKNKPIGRYQNLCAVGEIYEN